MSSKVVDLQSQRRRRRARAQTRNSNGEFHSGRSLQEKLRIVRLVAAEASRLFPEECPNPAWVQQYYWNIARSALEPRFGRIAQANEFTRQIRAELRDPTTSWRNVLKIANGASVEAHGLRKAPAEDPPGLPVGGTIAFALTIVARHLRRPTISALEYDEGVRALKRQRKRTVSGDYSLDRALPSSNTIISVVGSWPQALALAGLPPLDGLVRRPKGLPASDAIALYYAETGELPSTRKKLEAFAASRGFSLQRLRGTPWNEWLALGRKRIAEFPQLPPPPA